MSRAEAQLEELAAALDSGGFNLPGESDWGKLRIDQVWDAVRMANPERKQHRLIALSSLVVKHGKRREWLFKMLGKPSSRLQAAVYHIAPNCGIRRRQALRKAVESWKALGLLGGRRTLLVDLGGGTGSLIAALSEAANMDMSKLDYVIVEPDEARLHLAERVIADLGNLPSPRTFAATVEKFLASAMLLQQPRPAPDLAIFHWGDMLQSELEALNSTPDRATPKQLQDIVVQHRRLVDLLLPTVPAVLSVSLTGRQRRGQLLDQTASFDEEAGNRILFPCPSPADRVGTFPGCNRLSSLRVPKAIGRAYAGPPEDRWGESFCAMLGLAPDSLYYSLVSEARRTKHPRVRRRPFTGLTYRSQHRCNTHLLCHLVEGQG